MKVIIRNKKYLREAAARLLELSSGRRIFAFYGSLGAGKTTIIKVLCDLLGAVDMTASPTFTLVNEYRTVNDRNLYHIDFYRIKNKEEVFDFGLEEYLYSESYCFMEWPEMIEDMLPEGTVRVCITVGKNESRTLEISIT